MPKTKRRYLALALAMLLIFNLVIANCNAKKVKADDESPAASTTNELVWDAAAMLATVGEDVQADNGLKLVGNFTLGDDATGAANWGLEGPYAKSGTNGVKSGVPTSGDYFVFTAPDDGTLVVKEKTNKGKVYQIVDKDGNVLEKADNSAGTASSYDTISVELKKGDVVYGYCGGSKAAIFEMSFVPIQVVRTWDAAAMLATIGDDAKEDNGLKLVGNFTLGDDATGAANWGLEGPYAKSGTNGVKSGVPTSGDYFVFTAPENGKLIVKEKTNKGKVYQIVDKDGNVLEKADNSAGTASSYDTISLDLKKGDVVYGYCGGSKAAIFQMQFVMGEKTVTPWADVADPVITNVVVNEDGNFEITFDCEIDEYSGADSIEVLAMYNEGEAGSVIVNNNATKTVTITPNWSGDYKFYAVSRRAGEAEKTSNTVDYNDYVLALKKPVITWAANRGEGKVYLDWLNLAGVSGYSVSYKLSSDDAYTVAVENTSEGNATLDLVAGNKYDFRVEATRAEDGFVSNYVLSGFEVTADAKQEWNLAIVGSAQEAYVNIDGTDYYLDVQDNHTLVNHVANVKPLDQTSSVTIKAVDSGKIADSEDGVFLYYTRIDPKTENFKLTATMEITDTSKTYDNQTGFGIMSADMLGINYWGNPDYKHKYFNSVSVLDYYNSICLRSVSGYSGSDTMSNEDATRKVDRKSLNETFSMEQGTKYTFTLEKNDSGYTAKCNDASASLDNNIITAVQEDGSVIVGVVVARKIGVTISDVTFEKSASEAGIVGAIKENTVSPSYSVYSSGTCGADEYEFTAVANCEGTFVVYNPDGTVNTTSPVEADEVLRTNVAINVGSNVIKSEFLPSDGSAKITKETTVDCKRFETENDVIYVSPDGSSSGDGTKEAPLDLSTATKFARPGQTVYLLNGKYHATTIQRSVSGTADAPIYLVAEKLSKDGEDDGVIFDGSLTIVGSYWFVYGLYFKDSPGVSIQVAGNYNLIDRCTSNHSGTTGIQISRSGSASNKAGREGKLWPTGNIIINCTSFDSCDAKRNDADGFAAKLTVGEDNIFIGCIAYNNIDDGWDLYAKGTTGNIGAVLIMNCVTFNNGWLTTDDITAEGYEFGEGNGFKLGGEDLKGGHTLINSISFNNHGKGITSNSCPDDVIINCTTYGNQINNDGYNVGLNTKSSNLKEWKVEGLISMNTPDNTTTADLIPTSQHNPGNYIYNGSVSSNSLGELASEDWFESTDITKLPTRDEYGNIVMNGLFTLKDSNFASGAVLEGYADGLDVISPTFNYEIIEGYDQEVAEGEAKAVTVKSTAEMIKFVKVLLDDEELDASLYEVSEGSTVVTLSDSFVAGLSVGEHILTVVSTDGEAKTTLTIKGEEEVVTPQEPETPAETTEALPEVVNTGDSAQSILWLIVCVLSLGLLFISVKSKKENQ